MIDSPLVSPAWLADRLADPDCRVVDVREPWEYESIGHIPGAVNIPFGRYRNRDTADPGTLPGAGRVSQLFEKAGIMPETTVVAYDDTHGVFAARFVLTALAYGHTNVRLLDGDFTSWRTAFSVTTGQPNINASAYPLDGLSPNSPILDEHDLERTVTNSEVTLIDTREQAEYDAFHLPGAVRLDWLELVDDETRRIKTADEIDALLAARGIETDRSTSIVLYCNTARRLSHTFVVLRSLGFEDVRIFEGQLSDVSSIDAVDTAR